MFNPADFIAAIFARRLTEPAARRAALAEQVMAAVSSLSAAVFGVDGFQPSPAAPPPRADGPTPSAFSYRVARALICDINRDEARVRARRRPFADLISGAYSGSATEVCREIAESFVLTMPDGPLDDDRRAALAWVLVTRVLEEQEEQEGGGPVSAVLASALMCRDDASLMLHAERLSNTIWWTKSMVLPLPIATATPAASASETSAAPASDDVQA